MELLRWDTPSVFSKWRAAEPRRIDVLLANPTARRRVAAWGLTWGTGITTHAVQWMDVLAGPLAKVPVWCPPPALPAPRR